MHVSNVIGIALVLLGAVSMIVAAVQHRGYVATLPIVDLPPAHNRSFPVVLALVLGFLGLALSVYLAVGR